MKPQPLGFDGLSDSSNGFLGDSSNGEISNSNIFTYSKAPKFTNV